MQDRSRIPHLFKAIIDHDRMKPEGPVVSLKGFHEWRSYRRELTRAAERFIQRQRSGTTA